MDKKFTIMVIDDEPIVGKRVKRMFEKRGYEVEAFTDGGKALARLSEKKFNVVITDLKMGNVDGMTILTTVREQYPDTKVIIITGVGKWLIATDAFEKGAFDFIIKPFRFEELESAVKKVEEELAHD